MEKQGSYTRFVLENTLGVSDQLALVDSDTREQWTYAQLKQVVRSVGSALSRRGVQKGDVVATCGPNVLEHAAFLLAVPAIGGIPSGMNPIYTSAEMLRQIQKASAKYLLITSENICKVKDIQRSYAGLKEVFVIGSAEGYTSVRELMADDGAGYPAVEIDARNDIACLPFSSGTTGLPKGVILTHLSIITQLMWARREPSISTAKKGDILMAMFPFFHIAGFLTALLGLFQGCTIVIQGVFVFENYVAAIEKYRASVLLIAPPVLIRLLKDPLVDKYDISHLRMILVGAAPVGESLQREIATRLNVTDIRQGYGMTETGGVTHVSRGDEPVVHGSAGKLVPFIEDKIVEVTTGQTLGPGKTGELWVRTDTVMKGYLNDPKSTAETLDTDGWLHTGDLAYKDEDGNLFIVDRLKELIKYKGFQVAPAELEALLLTHSDVADAAVVGVPDERAGEVPKAFVVLKDGRGRTRPEDLRQYVDHEVAAFKRLRGGVEIIPVIPKNPSGKILRRTLRGQEKKSKL